MAQTKNLNIAAVILAAGSSSRMGRPKQLLQISGKALLLNAIETAQLSMVNTVVVVLGHMYETHAKLITDKAVICVVNKKWEKGLGSSIKSGIQEIMSQPHNVDGAILMVCDQPYLSPGHLNSLVNTYQNNSQKIIASSYQNTIGVPVLFPSNYFGELAALDDAHGAKKLLTLHKQAIVSINFPGGGTDLDTKEDYDNFLKNYKS